MRAKLIFNPEDNRKPIVIDIIQVPRKDEHIAIDETHWAEIREIQYPIDISEGDIILRLSSIIDDEA